jgi:hypothetical protein
MADRAVQQVPVLASLERWALVSATKLERELQAWRQQEVQLAVVQLVQRVSRREPTWAVPQEQPKLERRELALLALAAVRPVRAPRRPEPLVLLQPELVEQARQERAASRQRVEAEQQVFAEQCEQQLPWRLSPLRPQPRPQHPLQPDPEWCGALSPRHLRGWSLSVFSFP